MSFRVIIDGAEHDVMGDVKIIWEKKGENEDEQLHLTATSEGIILDKVIDQHDSDDTLSFEATAGYEVEDLLELTH